MSFRRELLLVGWIVVAAMTMTSLPRATAQGSWEWRRGPGRFVEGVAVDDRGNAYITGDVPDGSHFRFAMMLAKYGAGGHLLWMRSWREAGRSWARGFDVAVAPDGGVYVGGATGKTWLEGSDSQLWKYTARGHLEWHLSPRALVGGANKIVSVAAGRNVVLAAGQTYGCCDMAIHEGWIRAYRPDGRETWSNRFEAPGVRGTWDGIEAVELDALGRSFAAGHVDMAPQPDRTVKVDEEMLVQSLSRDGELRWSRMSHDRGVKDTDTATGVSAIEGRLLVSGSVDGSKGWLGRFTLSGERLWSLRWGPQMQETTTAGVSSAAWDAAYVVGTRWRPGPTAGVRDDVVTLFLRRFTVEGGLEEEREVPGWASDVAASSDAVYVTGSRHLYRLPLDSVG